MGTHVFCWLDYSELIAKAAFAIAMPGMPRKFAFSASVDRSLTCTVAARLNG
jgi:hypothetical protein